MKSGAAFSNQFRAEWYRCPLNWAWIVCRILWGKKFTRPLLEPLKGKHDKLNLLRISRDEIPSRRRCDAKAHSLIRGVLIQSCSAGAKNFTKCVFYHVQFSCVIQNIAYHRAIKTKFWKIDFYYIKLIILIIIDIDKQGQNGTWFSIFWITPLNCGWQNT